MPQQQPQMPPQLQMQQLPPQHQQQWPPQPLHQMNGVLMGANAWVAGPGMQAQVRGPAAPATYAQAAGGQEQGTPYPGKEVSEFPHAITAPPTSGYTAFSTAVPQEVRAIWN
jgi:hypothetical protein